MTINQPWTRDLRFAALAAVLARAAVTGEIEDTVALRVIRHELRRRNVNRTLKIEKRSRGAQDVIDRYEATGQAIPKNSSDDALHCDHVFALASGDLSRLQSAEAWLGELRHLDEVVCVTAAENYRLEVIEKSGTSGWEKYEIAEISFCESSPSK